MRAIARCKAEGAVLLTAKLDRLPRNVAFVRAPRDSGVAAVRVDMRKANANNGGNGHDGPVSTTGLSYHREVIPEMKGSALAELKKRGVVPGTPENLTLEAIGKGRGRRQNARADENNIPAAARANSMRISGKT